MVAVSASRTSVRLPHIQPGMRIGLFGGSFDPPHAGHREVSLVALRALGLDQVWWLVSPQNPLKRDAPSEDLDRRIAAARRLADDPRIKVTGVEAALRTNYTAETLRRLAPRLAGVHPVWMMGADNLATFHHWRDWRGIADSVPIAVFNRPGLALKALSSPAARALARFRIPDREAARLALMTPPAWVFLPTPHIPLSSTLLRQRRQAS
ncbi:MAG: nicotinate-nucleotide adenylyltransferase [Bauldia sp.]|uniref:nicotinate-nucleotide adenylyltransferase n=1 Tax=Bauldia sp. TaxID=2575872 RepID=UPI001D5A0B4D|nr:nicotinate-nucleotide adenylyltransferase [Bauldia sp.]MCB1496224.1 nicotinate-nucleotide adenylyltransferase [Bauldia sp.]